LQIQFKYTRKPSYTSVIHPEMNCSDVKKAVDVAFLDFSKAFDTVSHNILIGKVRKSGLDKWTVRRTENWLNGRAQRVVISGAEPS